jgi:hypothetical protein
MKKILALIVLASIGLVSFAQTTEKTEQTGSNEGMKTLFHKGDKVKVGWFVEVEPGYTKFDTRDVWMAGMSVGTILNHNFSIGLAGRGWMRSEQLYFDNVSDTTGAYLVGGYGGVLLEYTLFPKSLVHVTFPVMIGAGGANYITQAETYTDPDGKEWDQHHRTLDSQAFFVVEPGVRAEMNLFTFMRLNAGVSYRYVPNFVLMNTPKDMLNNFSVNIGLKFGHF